MTTDTTGVIVTPPNADHVSPTITRTADLDDVVIEDRAGPGYRMILVTRHGRHLASAKQTAAGIVGRLGVSGYMPMEDVRRMARAMEIVQRQAEEWKGEGSQP